MNKNELQMLFFSIVPGIMNSLDDGETLTGDILKIHLMTEIILEEIIRTVLGSNSEAVLSLDLRYAQKLSVCSKLALKDGSFAIPSDVVGSLRNLNKLRNNCAHDIDFKITTEDVNNLFIGKLRDKPEPAVFSGGVERMLSSYKALIYVYMVGMDEKL